MSLSDTTMIRKEKYAMKTTIIDIIEKSKEIEEIVKICQFSNPRLFKGVIPEEENHLFILIKKQSKLANIDMLAAALEALLPCAVNLTDEDELNSEYKTQVLQEAVPLHEKEKLLAVFDGIIFHEKSLLSEDDRQWQSYRLSVFHFFKENQEMLGGDEHTAEFSKENSF